MSSATISSCGTYRYNLHRSVQSHGFNASVIMVNPSTADADTDDATIRKLKGFAKEFQWADFTVVNKFAYRATDVNELRDASDPVGPANDGYIMDALLRTNITVVAWGSLKKLPMPLWLRWRRIWEMAQQLERSLYCLGTCADGHPKHPLMLGYATKLELWNHPYA